MRDCLHMRDTHEVIKIMIDGPMIIIETKGEPICWRNA